MTDQTGQWRTGVFATLAALVLAGPAAALPPPAPCVWNDATGTLEPVVDGVYPADMPEVFVFPAGEGFASWRVYDGHGEAYGVRRIVLQHCPTGQELLIVPHSIAPDRIVAAYDDMVISETPYTMRQIGEAMANMGAGVRMTENEFGSCGCDYVWGNG